MTKREKADDLFNEIAKGKQAAPAAQRSEDSEAGMVPLSIRLSPDDKERIERHFKGLGMRLATGLRVWILERAQREGIR